MAASDAARSPLRPARRLRGPRPLAARRPGLRRRTAALDRLGGRDRQAEKDPLLEEADYVVFDLETTGLGRGARICEIGAVRISALEQAATFETLVDPRADAAGGDHRADRDPPGGSARSAVRGGGCPPLHGLRGRRGARRAQRALRPLVPRPRSRPADRQAPRRPRARHARARADAPGRTRRADGPRLALVLLRHGGAAVPPRAARTPRRPARSSSRLIGLPRNAARARRRAVRAGRTAQAPVYDKRSLAHGAPQRPGVYLFYDAARAGALRRPRARPAGAAALVLPLRAAAPLGRGRARRGRPDRVARARLGARGRRSRSCASSASCARRRTRAQSRPDRYVYLRRRGDGIVVSQQPGELGPIRSRRQAELAARALAARLGGGARRPARPRRALSAIAREAARPVRQPALRGRGTAARPHRRRSSGSSPSSAGCERLRAPASSASSPRQSEPGMRRAFFLSAGRIQAVRTVPPGGAAPRARGRRCRRARGRARAGRGIGGRAPARRLVPAATAGQSSRLRPLARAPPGARPDPLLRFPHTGPRYGCPRAKGSSDSAPGSVLRCRNLLRPAVRSRPRSTSRAGPSRRGCGGERPLQASQAVRLQRRFG